MEEPKGQQGTVTSYCLAGVDNAQNVVCSRLKKRTEFRRRYTLEVYVLLSFLQIHSSHLTLTSLPAFLSPLLPYHSLPDGGGYPPLPSTILPSPSLPPFAAYTYLCLFDGGDHPHFSLHHTRAAWSTRQDPGI